MPLAHAFGQKSLIKQEKSEMNVAPSIREFVKRSPAAAIVSVAGTLLVAAPVGLQDIVSPTLIFIALLWCGVAVGSSRAIVRDTVIAAFAMGFCAYAAGTLAFATRS